MDSFNPNRNVRTLAQNFVNSTLLDGRAGILRVDLDGNPVNSQGILGDESSFEPCIMLMAFETALELILIL